MKVAVGMVAAGSRRAELDQTHSLWCERCDAGLFAWASFPIITPRHRFKFQCLMAACWRLLAAGTLLDALLTFNTQSLPPTQILFKPYASNCRISVERTKCDKRFFPLKRPTVSFCHSLEPLFRGFWTETALKYRKSKRSIQTRMTRLLLSPFP